MLGSGNLEKHLILPLCNKTPPSVNRFNKTIYGKLFNMSLEFDGMSPFQRVHRVQSVQWLQPRPFSCQPPLVSSHPPKPLSIFLALDREIKTHRRDNIVSTPEIKSRVPSWTFIRVCLWLTSPRSHGSSWLGKDFCLMVIIMWYSAYYNGSRVVSGCNMWGKGTLLFVPDNCS